MIFYDADILGIQHGVFKRLVMEELDIFAVKTSLSDQFHILECTEEWGIRQKISGTLINVPVRCGMRNSRILVYSDTATLIRSVIRDYVRTCGCKHELMYRPL
jgi:hypothetical protein